MAAATTTADLREKVLVYLFAEHGNNGRDLDTNLGALSSQLENCTHELLIDTLAVLAHAGEIHIQKVQTDGQYKAIPPTDGEFRKMLNTHFRIAPIPGTGKAAYEAVKPKPKPGFNVKK
jgi:hypothetical protein